MRLTGSFSENCARFVVDRIGHVIHGVKRDGLGPRQSGALAIGEERRLAACVEQIEPLLGFTRGAPVFRMNVQTERASAWNLKNPFGNHVRIVYENGPLGVTVRTASA